MVTRTHGDEASLPHLDLILYGTSFDPAPEARVKSGVSDL